MTNVIIVYWSGTGNTEKMAALIGGGICNSGGSVVLKRVAETKIEELEQYDVIVFGSPSMGAEVIEESEMEPFFAKEIPLLKNKKIALFGSYGWGDGEWMRVWVERIQKEGIELIDEGLPLNEGEITAKAQLCIRFGEKIVRCVTENTKGGNRNV